jgi:Tannase and feruloyl esterase
MSYRSLPTRVQAGGALWPSLALAVCVILLPGWANAAATTSPAVSCASLAELQLGDTRILSATHQSASAGLPGYCNVVGVIDERVSYQDPDHFTYGIVFELNLPDAWVGRFEVMGGGGLDGSVSNPTGFFGTELAQGWAVASDDGGHENPAVPPNSPPTGVTWQDGDDNAGGSAHFGVDEQAREDYGFNGILQTTLVSKRIVQHYYGEQPQHSYLCGCSNGGRDAMLAAERSPNLFDGVFAENPGFDLPQAAVAEAWNEQALAPLATTKDANGEPNLSTTFTNADLEVASAAILSACDGLDGLVDGIVDDFSACTNRIVYPALRRFTCRSGQAPHSGACLTAAQVGALEKIFAGPRNSAGKPLYASWYWDAGIWDPPTEAPALGWQAWNVSFFGNPAYNTSANLTLGAAAIPMVFTTPPIVTPVNGPASQEGFVLSYDFDTDAPKIFATAPGYPLSAMQFMAATSTDLRAFRDHGGRMIVLDSVNDGIFSGVAIVQWYEKLLDEQRDARGFVRLFMVPNMAHCGGGPGTTSFGANALAALTGWVEQGRTPHRIVAGNTDRVSPFPSAGLFDARVAANFPTGGTRPLCPYPRQSRYEGHGSTADAANFACVVPRREPTDRWHQAH